MFPLLLNCVTYVIESSLKDSPCEPTQEGTRDEGAGKRAREQPAASDRKAKSQRRKAKRGGQCCARPPDEHAIWRSEMKLKGASGGCKERHEVLSRTPDM